MVGLFAILFHLKKDWNLLGPNPFSTPFWSFLEMVSASNPFSTPFWARLPQCYSSFLQTLCHLSCSNTYMSASWPPDLRSSCLLPLSPPNSLSIFTQILLWPPLIFVSSLSATVFPFSFPPNPLSSLSCLICLYEQFKITSFYLFFFCLLS